MSIVTHGSSLPDSAAKTDFYGIIDNATVSAIVDADIAPGAGIQDSKLATISTAGKVNISSLTGQIANSNLAQITQAALVSGSALTLLSNIPSGAGLIPSANIGALFGTLVAKSAGQIYQAATDGLFIVATLGSTNNTDCNLYSDASSSPSTILGVVTRSPGIVTSACIPVKKNNYYECDSTNANVYFIPIGN